MSGRLARPRRLGGLRLRVAAGFALGGLVLVGVLSIATYFVAEHYLIRHRERSLMHQAAGDARVFEAEMRRVKSVPVVLRAMGGDHVPNADFIARVDGQWYRSSNMTGLRRPPPFVRAQVAAGRPAEELLEGSGPPVFVTGVPLPDIDAQYYEASRLVELHATLGVLRGALIAGGVLAVVLGGLGGWWLSRRVLRPVSQIATAARRVSVGDFGTRLERDRDPDLDTLATSFNEMVDSVDNRIQREKRFVADVSHELRSPVTAIATSIDLISTSALPVPPESRPAFDLLTEEVAHLRQLVEDLLELSRADAGVDLLQLDAVEVGEFMDHAVAPLRADHAQVVVAEDVAAERVLVDKRRLERVLANLVINAETHGGGLRRITVQRRNGTLNIAVEDQGGGVDPVDRELVFSRFYRGAVSGRRASESGSGLGLALVAEHVKLHGGRVSVEDVDGAAGARFVVAIPWRDP